MTKIATIRVFHDPNKPSGTKWLRCRAFFPPGALRWSSSLVLRGGCDKRGWQVESTSSRAYKDGSTRSTMLFCRFEAEPGVTGYEDMDLELSDGPGDEPLSYGGELPTGALRVVIGGREVEWHESYVLRSMPHYTALVHEPKSPLPPGVWAKLYSEVVTHSTLTPCTLRVGWSDPSDSATWKELNLPVEITATGSASIIYPAHMQRRLPLFLGELNDGQAVSMPFEVQWSSSPAVPRVQAFQLDPVGVGGFGLMGRPRSQRFSISDAVGADLEAQRVIDSTPVGCFEAVPTHPSESGTTGTQGRFGVLAPGLWLFGGSARGMNMAELAFHAESARPIWLFGPKQDGLERLPVSPNSNPKVVWWGERPYPAAGADMLGKEGEINPYTHGARTSLGGLWTGMDEQHGQDMSFIAYGVLSGDPAAERMLLERAKRWVGCLSTSSGNPTVDGVGSGRAARMLGMLAVACDALEIPGGFECLDGNLLAYKKQWEDDNQGVPHDVEQRVLPQQVYGPSGQAGGLNVLHWRPWEDAIAATEILRCYALEGLSKRELALSLAATIATNIVLHGMEKLAGTGEGSVATYRLYTALAWNDGKPLTPAELLNPELARDGSGAGYTLWAYPALVAARSACIMLGELVPALRSQVAPIIALAAKQAGQVWRSVPSAFELPEMLSVPVDYDASEWLAIETLPTPEWAKTLDEL